MKSYIHGDPLVPVELRDKDTGLRPSHEALLRLIDTTDPAWPTVAALLREMADAGVKVDEAAFGIAVKVGAHRFAAQEAKRQASRRITYVPVPLASTDSIVYYVRRGDLIKIGTTVDPARRFSALLPDEILAYEPGGPKEETFRHRQFSHLKGRGDHFRQAPELLEHVRCVREMYGDPDPSWPTVATHRVKLKSAVLTAPEGGDGEMLPAAELAVRLGMKEGTLRSWIHHGRLVAYGRNERGHLIFCLESATALRDALAARRSQGTRSKRKRGAA